MKIAIAQIDIAWENALQNMKTCSFFLQQAHEKKCDLVIFPEMSLTGFSMNVESTSALYEQTVRDFSALAVQYKLHIGFGVVQQELSTGKYYNVFAMVDREGVLVNEYRKIHPFTFGEESKYFSEGLQPIWCELNGVRFGCTICYDLRFPELFQILSQRASCIINIANWPSRRHSHWCTLLQARAIENQCFIIGVNRCGQDPTLQYNGGSMFISPTGEVLSSCASSQELLVVDMEPNEVKTAQSSFPMRTDRKPWLYARNYLDMLASQDQHCPFLLSKQVVAVTGGCGLIGRALCTRLAQQGATVIIADLDEEQGVFIAKELAQKYDTEVEFVHLDITDTHSISRFIMHCHTTYGRLDSLVNNAYPRNKQWGTHYEQLELESWKENIDLHLNGYFSVSHAVSKYMIEQKSGKILFMTSIYGVVGPDFTIYEGTQMTMPPEYAAIKGALINFARYMAAYLGPYGITVNCVSPGGIWDNQPKSFVSNYNTKVPLRRMGCPEDIAGVVAFLLSNSANYITGHNLLADGGWCCI